jgi:hypothetical protein
MTTPTTTAGTTMRALIQENYGEAESVLRLGQVGRPAIGDREVLLRVHAADVDVWHLVAGLSYAVRLAGTGSGRPRLPYRAGRSPRPWMTCSFSGCRKGRCAERLRSLCAIRARPEEITSLTGLLPVRLPEGALPTGVTVSRRGQIRCDLHGLHRRQSGTRSGGCYAMAGGQRSSQELKT